MVDADNVRTGLQARRGEWKDIATRAGVSHSWISQFVRGLIDNPGYRTLESIQSVLADQQQDERARAA